MNARGSKAVELIKTVTLEGTGVVGDVYREVTWYYDQEGYCVAIYDPMGTWVLMGGIVYKSKPTKEAV